MKGFYTTMEDKIIEILSLSKFLKRSELRAQLIAHGYVIPDRKLRATIERMITEGHYLISSSEKGYSLITNEADLTESMRYLKAKAEAISIRANSLIRNWREKHNTQQFALFV